MPPWESECCTNICLFHGTTQLKKTPIRSDFSGKQPKKAGNTGQNKMQRLKWSHEDLPFQCTCWASQKKGITLRQSKKIGTEKTVISSRGHSSLSNSCQPDSMKLQQKGCVYVVTLYTWHDHEMGVMGSNDVLPISPYIKNYSKCLPREGIWGFHYLYRMLPVWDIQGEHDGHSARLLLWGKAHGTSGHHC